MKKIIVGDDAPDRPNWLFDGTSDFVLGMTCQPHVEDLLVRRSFSSLTVRDSQSLTVRWPTDSVRAMSFVSASIPIERRSG